MSSRIKTRPARALGGCATGRMPARPTEVALVEVLNLRYEGESLSFPLQLGSRHGQPMSVIHGHADLAKAEALQPGT